MHLSSWFAVMSVATLASCRAVPNTATPHESVTSWTASREEKQERLSADKILPMRIALKQQNLDQGEDWLMDVADPDSPRYGQHWTAEDVIAAFQPADDTVAAVMAWLKDAGIAPERITHTDNKQWLAFDATTEEAETLLQTQYHRYQLANGDVHAGCDEYFLPDHLREHIDFIKPAVVRAPMIVSKKTVPRTATDDSGFKDLAVRQNENTSAPSPCFVNLTPECIRRLYNFSIQASDAPVNSKNRLGIYEIGQVYSQFDNDVFFQQYAPFIANGTAPITDSIDGGVRPNPNSNYVGGEAELDFQVAYPIVYPQELVLYSSNDAYYAYDTNITGFFNIFLDALDGSYCNYTAYGETGNSPLDPSYPDPNAGGYKGKLMCGTFQPTNVISISWTQAESSLPASYQKRQCNEWLKLGLQGVSVFIAAGDVGVANDVDSAYGIGPNGCLGPNDNVYSPNFPVNCPWVTAVGATMLNTTVEQPEVAVTEYDAGFLSGGGFSNIYPVPKYQRQAVETFFSRWPDQGVPYYTNGIAGLDGNTTGIDGPGYNLTKGVYNRNGRGYPDVAANGANVAVVQDGYPTVASGTSASTPLFAGLVHRVNLERERAGKSPVGFINPVVYKHPEILRDITSGSNPGEYSILRHAQMVNKRTDT